MAEDASPGEGSFIRRCSWLLRHILFYIWGQEMKRFDGAGGKSRGWPAEVRAIRTIAGFGFTLCRRGGSKQQVDIDRAQRITLEYASPPP
jgi:hypothetical protein